MPNIRRLAIINRGEPAMRCLAAVGELASDLGEPVTTIALYTEPDAASWFVREAIEAFPLGPALITDPDGGRRSAYTDIDRLMAALTAADADAVWPGWGFVAESGEFAARCEAAGITFIGPPSDVIRLLGNKMRAKQLCEGAGVPVIPWSGGPVHDAASARIAARMLGYPVLVKAAAGGGGRGIRLVESDAAMAAAFASAQAEAEHAFGDPTVFIERRLDAVRHVEVQVIADGHGTAWAVGVRDCSIQRRNQKVIEESGCTQLDEVTRAQLAAAAVRLCHAAGYRSAGTVEFLFDPQARQFMFMEVNTRLQVEHPVTEMTTGIDLVKLQLHVARGGRLAGDPPVPHGYAIEARLNAEDPERGFVPTPGRVSALRLPAGPGIRVDAGVAEGDEIPAEFDSMIAKVVAWGKDRSEALGRLRRGLAQSLVVIDGGTTNKAFLLSLAGRPELLTGTYDNQWLDRLMLARGHLPAPHPVALLAAAAEAAEADQAAVQANFLATAARGRPALPDTVGHVLQLRVRGSAYRLHVYGLGAGDYRILTGDGPVDVHVVRLGRYERAVTCRGRRHRVVATAQGPRLLVEADGVAHTVTRDDGGQVRCPSPAFVVAVLVAPGDAVRAGDPLVVVESMKMETTITAPYAGTIKSVTAPVNTQVEAGAPLVRLQPPDEQDAHPGEPGGAVCFAALADTGGNSGHREIGRTLRGYLLGYDVEDSEARQLSRQRTAQLTDLPPDDPEVLQQEQELLEVFADIAALSRRVPSDADDAHARSSHEYLLTYLAFLDPARSGTPGDFTKQLQRVLARYGVRSLARTPELEQAMLRIYRSVGRIPAAAPIVIAILDRWRRAHDVLSAAMTDDRLAVLGQLIVATQGRCPDVCDLAREVRFGYVDAPLLKRIRGRAYAEIEDSLDELSGHPAAARGRELTSSIVWFPLPMRAMLRDRYRSADETTRARLLEVRTRRFYRIRDLNGLRCRPAGPYLTCVADYDEPGQHAAPVHLVTAYVPLAELPAFASALTAQLRRLRADRPVVVDVESWRDEPLLPGGQMASELAGLLAHTEFGRHLHRLTVTVTSATGGSDHAEEHERTQSFTYQHTAAGFVEDPLFRNMHPMIAERLDLWRLSNFSLRRLHSAEDVYLFHAVAHANPKDERLIALAEVRDLTPARDSSGTILGYPHMEGILTQAFADIRHALGGRPPRQRPLSNRVILYVRPTWDIPTSIWRSLAHRLAPLAADLGLEKIAVRIRIADPATGEPREAVLDVENVEDAAVAVRMRPPTHQRIQPLTEYKQKALRAQRLGAPYPYELIRMLTPPPGAPADFPAGEFTEYDLRGDDGELVPVDRPYGQNTAGIVTGVITSYTALVPEGMHRVAVIGDPTAGLGNLAEPECRRILAALDLADRMRVPVEWFALSSGARIAWDSGTENMDWIAAVLRRLIEFTQSGGEVNVVVTGINVGAQPYWNAEATMLMHTRGILIMTPASAMVLTGKSSLDYSGGVSAEDNFGIGGFERVMGPNGQAQYWAPTLAGACALLLQHYAHTYVVPGERHPRRAPTTDPAGRDICTAPHRQDGEWQFATVGDVFSAELNGERKKPFDMRSVMRAVTDSDHVPVERWARWRDAETAIVWEARIGGFPVCLIGLESQTVPRPGFVPADGPPSWTAGTLFPQSSRKVARAINAASGNRPVVVLANLAGFDGSPESMRNWQLEYGAEIGRAVTNFRGPIVFVVVSRYHGGAFVVFSKRLHADMETAAVAGSYASVIGGAPAAAVVLSRHVSARTDADPRVASLRARLASETGKNLADLHEELAEVTQAVRAEKLKEVADEFDRIHDIRRAMRVGSVDRIIAPADLRPFVIRALERRLGTGVPAGVVDVADVADVGQPAAS